MYYDGCELLSQKDINGNTPEIFLSEGNRSSGKTTYFTKLLINRYIKYGKKFAFLYRYNYELDDCSEKIFKDVKKLFFSDYEMASKPKMKGIYHNLFLNKKHCGYAISINSSDQIKRNSHLFNDIEGIFFDEFQSETNHYCPNEVEKFVSIHRSIARGHGQQSRYVPVYMVSNCVSLLNPYFAILGVSDRIRSDTRFLRGAGWVLEHSFIETAATAQQNSLFMQAFGSTRYATYAMQNIYLQDNRAFIEKLSGKNNYICTIKYEGKNYGISEYPDSALLYCSTKANPDYPIRIVVSATDHAVNYVMQQRNSTIIQMLRAYFDRGLFRFQNLECKSVIINAISYKM